jgi:hypothetical protein
MDVVMDRMDYGQWSMVNGQWLEQMRASQASTKPRTRRQHVAPSVSLGLSYWYNAKPRTRRQETHRIRKGSSKFMYLPITLMYNNMTIN